MPFKEEQMQPSMKTMVIRERKIIIESWSSQCWGIRVYICFFKMLAKMDRATTNMGIVGIQDEIIFYSLLFFIN